jgi:hypothetical protein
MPWLAAVKMAAPPAVTVVDALCHCTCMHGLGLGPMVKVQPEIVTTSACVHTVSPAVTAD